MKSYAIEIISSSLGYKSRTGDNLSKVLNIMSCVF